MRKEKYISKAKRLEQINSICCYSFETKKRIYNMTSKQLKSLEEKIYEEFYKEIK